MAREVGLLSGGQRLLVWFLLVAFPVPLVVLLWYQMGGDPREKIFIALGMMAYCWWLLAIVLSTRPRRLEQYVGLPHLYALHGMLGVAGVVAMYLHSDNLFAAGIWARNFGQWAFVLALVLPSLAVFFLSGWITDHFQAMQRLKRSLEKVLRHQLSVWIHRLNLVVVLLVWLHVHVIEKVARHLLFMVLFDICTIVTLTLYVWKKWLGPDAMETAVVVENAALNSLTRGFRLRPDKASVTARPGDFYFIRVEHSGMSREWHPFSLANAGENTLLFTIRQVGDYTRMIGQVPVGARVRLEGPYGRFDDEVAKSPAEAPLVLIGMGSGVAPLLSLAAGHPGRRIRLLWSVRRTEDAFYPERIRDLQQRSGGRMTATIQVGRLTWAKLRDTLTAEERGRGEFFMVGPNAAISSLQRPWRGLGVPWRRMHHERLTM